MMQEVVDGGLGRCSSNDTGHTEEHTGYTTGFKIPQTQALYNIAKWLHKTNLWRLYISDPTTASAFAHTIQSPASFDLFLCDPFACLTDFVASHGDDLDVVGVAMRIRAMLFDPGLADVACAKDAEDGSGHRDGIQALNALDSSLPFTHNVPHLPSIVAPKDADMFVPVDDMYYTLDYDAELLSTLDVSQPESHPTPTKHDEKDTTDPSPHETVQVHSSLQHLFKIIQASSDPHQLKSLKKLLTDARPSKSKWANDDRVGQEQLYESFEYVLTELKNTTDHSIPFLKPVNRREAPNYFEIIKHPMDLGTMTRKLKALQYNSKDEFVNDLNLIWSNCLTYNTYPDSIYRRHANAMKRRSSELLKKVPDIVIKPVADESDSDEVEAESRTKSGGKSTTHLAMFANSNSTVKIEKQDHDAASAWTGYAHAAPEHISSTGVLGQVHLQPNTGVQTQASAAGGSVSTCTENGVHPGTAVENGGNGTNGGEGDVSGVNTPGLASSTRQVCAEVDLTHDACLQIQRWKQVTLAHRTEMLRKRVDQDRKPFGNRQALIRDGEAMGKYHDQYMAYLLRAKHRTTRLAIAPSEPSAQLDDDSAMSNGASSVCLRPSASSGGICDDHQDGECATSSGLVTSRRQSSESVHHPASIHSSSCQTHTDTADPHSHHDGASDSASTQNQNRKRRDHFNASFLPELQHFCSSLPLLDPIPLHQPGDLKQFYEPHYVRFDDSVPPAPPPSMSEYPTFLPNPSSKLYQHMLRNTNELKRIKHTYNKMMLLQAPNGGGFVKNAGGSCVDVVPYTPQWKAEALPPAVIDYASATSILGRFCAMNLLHCGFDGVSEMSLSCLTEIAGQYLHNLGKSMQIYLDAFGERTSHKDILLHALDTNGIQDPDQLIKYIQTDIQKATHKITKLRTQLDTCYADLEVFHESVSCPLTDVPLDDMHDEIASGHLFVDAGVDLLGLREIGIDLTAVPAKVWNRKSERPLKSLASRRADGDKPDDLGVVVLKVEKWDPIDPAKQIGLVASFYEKKGATVEELAVDEYRLKTKEEKQLLKIAQQFRKRPTNGQSFLDDANVPKKRKKVSGSDASGVGSSGSAIGGTAQQRVRPLEPSARKGASVGSKSDSRPRVRDTKRKRD